MSTSFPLKNYAHIRNNYLFLNYVTVSLFPSTDCTVGSCTLNENRLAYSTAEWPAGSPAGTLVNMLSVTTQN